MYDGLMIVLIEVLRFVMALARAYPTDHPTQELC
jgi:hypothetical protein